MTPSRPSALSLPIRFLVALAAAACGACSGSNSVDAGLDAVSTSDSSDILASDAPGDSGDATPPDTGEASAPCVVDRDCTDRVFCNGDERCMPGAPGTDARGCIAGSPPCPSGQTCDEAATRCSGGCPDADHDGHHAMFCGGDDCDDADANRFPGNPEVCAFVAGDGGAPTRADPSHDEDCDPATIANATTRDGDHDGDGFIDRDCSNIDSSGGVTRGNDCDDLVSPSNFAGLVPAGNIHPMQPEACNGVDDNCDGSIDEGLPTGAYYPDCDGDGSGDARAPAVGSGCAPQQFAQCAGHPAAPTHDDCDDAQSAVHVGAPEVCDSLDNNCNGMTDEGTLATFYRDADGDSFGDPAATMQSCPAAPPAGYVTDRSDCDDTCATCHPGSGEVCDHRDNNCNGSTDEGTTVTFYRDADGDTYGGATTLADCAGSAPAGYVARAGDCCDTDARAHPSGGQYDTPRMGCGGFDFDCNGIQSGDNSLAFGTCSYSASTMSCSGASAGWTSLPACGATGTFLSGCAVTPPGSMMCSQPSTMRTRACQ